MQTMIELLEKVKKDLRESMRTPLRVDYENLESYAAKMDAIKAGEYTWKDTFPYFVEDFGSDMKGPALQAQLKQAKDYGLFRIPVPREIYNRVVPFCRTPFRLGYQLSLLHALEGVSEQSRDASTYLKNIYRKYYSKEVKTIKKFHRLGITSVNDLLDGRLLGSGWEKKDFIKDPLDEQDERLWMDLARILVMSRLYGCDTDNDDCKMLFMLLHHNWLRRCKFLSDQAKKAQALSVDKQEANKIRISDMLCDRFIDDKDCELGFFQNLISVADKLGCDFGRPQGLYYAPYQAVNEEYIQDALALGATYDENDYDEDSFYVAMQANAAVAITALNADNIIDEARYVVDILEDAIRGGQAGNTGAERAAAPAKDESGYRDSQPDEDDTREEMDALREEMDALRQRLKEKESLAAHFKEEYTGAARYIKDLQAEKAALEEELKKQSEDNEKLGRLLDTAEEVELSNSSVSREEAYAYLSKKRVVLAGGDCNWVNKLRNMFPGWYFFDSDTGRTADTGCVKKADYVFIFTKTLSHKLWRRFRDAAIKYQVPYDYIQNVNIGYNIEYLYDVIRAAESDRYAERLLTGHNMTRPKRAIQYG